MHKHCNNNNDINGSPEIEKIFPTTTDRHFTIPNKTTNEMKNIHKIWTENIYAFTLHLTLSRLWMCSVQWTNCVFGARLACSIVCVCLCVKSIIAWCGNIQNIRICGLFCEIDNCGWLWFNGIVSSVPWENSDIGILCILLDSKRYVLCILHNGVDCSSIVNAIRYRILVVLWVQSWNERSADDDSSKER